MNPLRLSPRHLLACIALLACTLATSAFAQADPPGRIGRIAVLSGTVNLYNPTTGESFSAPRNQPLTSGDILSTEPDARTEIQIGSMSVRLDGATSLQLVQIDDAQVRLYLDRGRAIAKLDSRETLDDFSLETRDGRFTARNTGIYRVDTDESHTTGTAYYGALRFDGRDGDLDIGAGQSARFTNGFQTRHGLSNAIQDDFTRWSAARDQRLAAGNSSRYVSPEMTGATDLDDYGQWSETPEYGAIWFPRSVAADWAPYRSGHWAWVAPWGWTWVGHEPWGFAPFHYGRWVRHHGIWGWVPGARLARPVYAPALVAWTSAPGIHISISSGRAPTVGWFPLAPREVYVPIYRSSEHHVRRVNATHVSTIPNLAHIVSNPHEAIRGTHYTHRAAPHALTQSAASTFNRPTAHRAPTAPASSFAPTTRDASRHAGVAQPTAQGAPQSVPPTEPRHRRDGSEREALRTENRPTAPQMSVPAPPVTTTMPRRFVEPSPNTSNTPNATNSSLPRTRTERPEPRLAESPATVVGTPPAAPRPMPPLEARPQTERREHSERADRAFTRREREATAPAPVPQTRPEAQMARPAPRAEIRSEAPAARETRIETRREARQDPPREIARPPEARVEARSPRPEEPRRQEREERGKDHRPRNEAEKRS